MALLFCESFDWSTTSADYLAKWAGGLAGGSVIVGAGGRNGSNGMNYDNGALTKGVGTPATFISGFAYKWGSAGARVFGVAYDGASLQDDLYVDATGLLSVRRGGSVVLATSTRAIALSQFYFIEWKVFIHASAGTVEVRVNDEVWISATGLNTQATANAYVTSVGIAAPGGSSLQTFDDFYICDTTGTANTTFLGDIRVQAILPTGAGATTGWTPSAGANYQNVDEAAENGDTDYNSTATAGAIDTFAMGNVSPSTGSVKGVQHQPVVRKDDAGTRTVAPIARIGATDHVAGAGVNVNTTYAPVVVMAETSPATGAAWTIAEVNAAEFGVKLIA